MRFFSHVLVLLSSCGAVPLIDENMQNPAYCEPACKNLENLGCDFYDTDCVEFCLHSLEEPINAINPECVARAKSCADAETCQ